MGAQCPQSWWRRLPSQQCRRQNLARCLSVTAGGIQDGHQSGALAELLALLLDGPLDGLLNGPLDGQRGAVPARVPASHLRLPGSSRACSPPSGPAPPGEAEIQLFCLPLAPAAAIPAGLPTPHPPVAGQRSSADRCPAPGDRGRPGAGQGGGPWLDQPPGARIWGGWDLGSWGRSGSSAKTTEAFTSDAGPPANAPGPCPAGRWQGQPIPGSIKRRPSPPPPRPNRSLVTLVVGRGALSQGRQGLRPGSSRPGAVRLWPVRMGPVRL